MVVYARRILLVQTWFSNDRATSKRLVFPSCTAKEVLQSPTPILQPPQTLLCLHTLKQSVLTLPCHAMPREAGPNAHSNADANMTRTL